jgi:putative drug exporter of the RND superfamily
MKRILAIPAGRRAKWVVVAVWVGLLVVFSILQFPTKFEEVQKNDSASFLPASAESTKALEAVNTIQGEETVAIVTVYRRPSGLTAADRALIEQNRKELNALKLAATTPFGRPIPSENGQASLLVANITTNGEAETILDPVDKVREVVNDPGGGLEVKVTGSAGFSADAIKIFEGINGTLLFAAIGLVFFLLAVIYRSPIFLWIPLFTVIFAELASRSIGYLLTEFGVTINGQSSSIMSILVLGAGTDYALLLVSRYREELRQHDDKHVAAANAASAAGPAIIASGVTVMLALFCLTLAEVNGTAGLGPLGALGVGIAMIAMLTLLPALLAITGRRAFWPFIPRVGDEGADAEHGRWRRWGEWIQRRPRAVWIVTSLLLVAMSFGLLNFSTGLTQGNSYRGDVESVQGQELLATSFPAGENAPTDVVVPDKAKVKAVASAVAAVPGVVNVRPAGAGPPGVQLAATLTYSPYATEAYDVIPGIRTAAKEAGGANVLVGGPTAIETDLRAASTRDTKLIIPIVLIVVFLVLIVLLRAFTAPLLLMLTVILSFAAALGVSAVVYDVVFGFPGSDPGLPLFAFVFLVALGIDYNIFLMARVREESLKYGTERGMIRGLAVTGGVITSAGIVLAGTFAILGTLPLVFLTELGFAIAFGVLLDTFVVRSTLVPALVLDIGKKIWWPSKLAHEGEPGEHMPEEEPDADADAGSGPVSPSA